MALPFATTTITVKRSPVASDYDEPYTGPPTLDDIATGVRAVIYAPTGRELQAGGEQTQIQLRFTCDLTDLKNRDFIQDDALGLLYRVVWNVPYPGEHIEGGLELVEGLI